VTYTPKPRSRAWVDRVGALLRDGLGVEDIALKLECEARQVRAQVALFRGAGLLKKWWPKQEVMK
jgi:hypothetical protein